MAYYKLQLLQGGHTVLVLKLVFKTNFVSLLSYWNTDKIAFYHGIVSFNCSSGGPEAWFTGIWASASLSSDWFWGGGGVFGLPSAVLGAVLFAEADHWRLF